MKRLFINGKIFTSNRKQLYAEAILTEDGRITWVGGGEEAIQIKDSLCPDEVIDLAGRTVIPGFVDAHMHPMMLAEYSRQIACLPPKINSIRQLSQAIAQAAEDLRTTEDARTTEVPRAAESGAGLPWICGWGYDEGKYEEKRSPNRYDLDEGCADLPVFLVRSCEHIRCVNSKALEIAGITRDTPDPPGGSIDRDEQGEPTGILRENARDLVLPYMPAETEEDLISALTDLGELLTSQGIVAVADMGNLHAGGNYDYYIKAVEKGFRQRVALYYMWDYFMDEPAFAITPEVKDGESATAEVKNGETIANCPYVLQEGDKIFFRLKRKAEDDYDVICEKECEIDVENNQAILKLVPIDTESCEFKEHRYECELVTFDDFHSTFIENQPFTIGKELEKHAE